MPRVIEKYSLYFEWFGGEFGAYEEIRYPLDVKSWESAVYSLSKKEFIDNGNKFKIMIDWSKALEDYRRSEKFIQKIKLKPKTKKEAKRVLDLIQPKPISIPCIVHIESRKKKKLKRESSRFFVWYFLHEVFLLLNLSSPGSANFYSLKIPSKTKYTKTDLNLSAAYFELAWIRSLDEKDPKIDYIPLQKVIEWYNHFQIGF